MSGFLVDDLLFARDQRDGNTLFFEVFISFQSEQAEWGEIVSGIGCFELL